MLKDLTKSSKRFSNNYTRNSTDKYSQPIPFHKAEQMTNGECLLK
jgi:hypothetical protein